MLEADINIARQNGGILDLKPGETVVDGEGERARFLSYGARAPIYVNLEYKNISGTVRLPNSELRRAR